MEFMVKYEDVPYFCFWCGRIGHADRECPEEDLDGSEMRFGVELRASPFKKATGRQLAFHRASPAAKRGLNYSGLQKEKVSSFSASMMPRGGSRVRLAYSTGGAEYGTEANPGAKSFASTPREDVSMETDGDQGDNSHKTQGAEEEKKGESAGQDVGVNSQSLGRVSGLNSFEDSSVDTDATRAMGTMPSPGPQVGRQGSHNDMKLKMGGASQHLQAKSPRAAKDVQKQKKARKALNPSLIVDTM